MQLKAIWIYPIKSLGGFNISSWTLEARGLKWDRRWMLIDDQRRFLSQREHPEMALFRTSISEDNLMVTYPLDGRKLQIPLKPSMPHRTVEVEIWEDRVSATLVSADADQYFSQLLNRPCQLVHMRRNDRRNIDPAFNQGYETVSFADGYPYLIANTASLAAISTKHGEFVDARRFRANLIIETNTAFEEDRWEEVKIGKAHFRLVKPCARCQVLNVNPDTAEVDHPKRSLLRTLAIQRTANNKTYFGMNACWDGGADLIEIGDEIEVASYG